MGLKLKLKFSQEGSCMLWPVVISWTICHLLLSHVLTHNISAVMVWSFQLGYQLFSSASHIYWIAQRHTLKTLSIHLSIHLSITISPHRSISVIRASASQLQRGHQPPSLPPQSDVRGGDLFRLMLLDYKISVLTWSAREFLTKPDNFICFDT